MWREQHQNLEELVGEAIRDRVRTPAFRFGYYLHARSLLFATYIPALGG